MNILVTGASGFIGYHLCKSLITEGYNVIGIDNLNNYYDVSLKSSRLKGLVIHKNFKFFKGDISSYPQLNLLKKERIDIVVHLAAQAGVRVKQKNYKKYFKSNSNGFFNVLQFCVNSNISKLIYASSSSVYSGLQASKFSESMDLPTPINYYAYTKLENERLADFYYENFDINSFGLRFFTVYGPYGRPDMAYFLFAKQISANQPIYLNNNGAMGRDMTFVSDIVDGILRAVKYSELNTSYNHKINLGNNRPVRTINLLKNIEKLLGSKANVIDVISSGEMEITHADISLAKKKLGYQPKVRFEDGISEFIDWFKNFGT